MGCLREFGCNLSGFAGERLHIPTKKIARSAYKKMAGTITDRLLAHWMTTLREERFEPVKLAPKMFVGHDLRYLYMLQRVGVAIQWFSPSDFRKATLAEREAMPAIFTAIALRTPKGRFHRNDLLLFRDGPTLCAGFARLAFAIRARPPTTEYFVFVKALCPTDVPLRFNRAGGREVLVPAAALVHPVAWYELEGGIVQVIGGTERFD